ncbi:MAG: DUF1573 domain-containing protein [Acidobacteriota bacterium]
MKKRNLKRAIAVSLGLLSFLFFGYLASAAGKPKITFKETSWNFGKVKQGDLLKHEFVFTNEGDGTLVIKKVSTTCGCTGVLLSDDEIAPGKQGKLEVKFDTRGYGGQVSKLIFVDSNDPAEPQKQLEVRADIETPPSPKIEINPYNYDAGLMVEGEEIKANLLVMNKGELELKVELNHRSATFFVGGKPAPTPLKIAAGKETAVEVRIPAQNRTGIIREYVLIKSNDPMRMTLSLYLSGYVISKEQLKELFNKYKDLLR